MKSAIAIALTLLMCVPLALAEDTPEQGFRDLENRISHAVMTRDVTEMNKLFATDYISVGVSGKVRTRAEVIEAYSSGKLAISTSHTDKITVRQYGDIAIVVGSITVSGKEGSTDIGGVRIHASLQAGIRSMARCVLSSYAREIAVRPSL